MIKNNRIVARTSSSAAVEDMASNKGQADKGGGFRCGCRSVKALSFRQLARGENSIDHRLAAQLISGRLMVLKTVARQENSLVVLNALTHYSTSMHSLCIAQALSY
jgi:hypothetical protein